MKKTTIKKTIGCVEIITLKGTLCSKKVVALIDTGATYTCIDKKIAEEIGFEKITRHIKIKLKASEENFVRRPVIKTCVGLDGAVFDVEANIEDRSNMTFPVIVGRNVLYNHFLVDVEKNNTSFIITEQKDSFGEKIKDLTEN
ncbi:MAG: ATP-dependent zinc protease [Candidatus Aenigmarchaeota archaeon]|nr:ATP-dependent zinc protease [Candidatus Aenigmarchaeota archaeon]